MATPHPDFAQLAARCVDLAKGAPKPCTSLGFRFAALKYGGSKDLLSGQGARTSGGRINAIGAFPVIYTSTDPGTATAETFRNFAAFGFEKSKVRPRVFVGVEIKLAAVLDLSDRRIRRRLKLNLKDLAQPWLPEQEAGREALTQAIGRAAYEAGYEAVMLPSACRKGGINLNVCGGAFKRGQIVCDQTWTVI